MEMKKKCDCNGCCSTDIAVSDYDDMIEQLKETRDNIDKMIHTLEHRKVKDDVINRILNSNYEEEDEDIIDEIISDTRVNTYTIPFDKVIYYPYYKYYPYFKY